ncbi:MAG: ROK family protein [Pseudomonadota bacterium]
MPFAIGIDVGGTFVKAGLVDEAGAVAMRAERPTNAAAGEHEIEKGILAIVSELKAAAPAAPAGVGIGVPGMVRIAEGIVARSPNIACWKDYRAKERLEAALGETVILDNDANMAAVAEGWTGAGKGIRSFLAVTLGTGIGSGIVLDGRLWHGDTGRAGELGHLVVEPGGAECGCGGRGCVERYASADGMRRLAREAGLDVDVPALMALAAGGSVPARDVFRTAGRSLGSALGAWFNMTDVRTVIVGGGALPSLPFLLPHVREVLSCSVYGVEESELRILEAGLGADAGIIGSARSAMLARGCRPR